jgi:hypothetical protein
VLRRIFGSERRKWQEAGENCIRLLEKSDSLERTVNGDEIWVFQYVPEIRHPNPIGNVLERETKGRTKVKQISFPSHRSYFSLKIYFSKIKHSTIKFWNTYSSTFIEKNSITRQADLIPQQCAFPYSTLGKAVFRPEVNTLVGTSCFLH